MAKYKFQPPAGVEYTLIIVFGAIVVGVLVFFSTDVIPATVPAVSETSQLFSK